MLSWSMSENASNDVATSNSSTPSSSVPSQVPPPNVHNQSVEGDDSEKSSSTGRKRRKAQLASTKTGNQSKKLANWRFNADNSRSLIAKMIAKHNYHLNMVGHAYFREFVKSVTPSANLILDVDTHQDILKLYNKMKLELQECLKSLTSKCSLGIDMCTIESNPVVPYDAYCCVNCHYIDDDWMLHKKIIAYVPVSFTYTGEALGEIVSGEVLGEIVKSVALEWNIDVKLLALAADNSFSSDVMMGNTKEWLNGNGSLILEGDLFQMRCSNQILHLIAQKGIEVAARLIVKIRECVKYIWSSQSRKDTFINALMQVKLAGQLVHLDVDTRWVSTYQMLKSAIDSRQGFVRFAKLDSGFKCLLPSSDEWKQGKMICECLKVFYDITSKFAWGAYPTTAMYFKSIYEVNKNILTWESSNHKCIRDMALKMRGDFDKYWNTCSLLMSVAVVLDPRYKAQMVNFVFHKLHGEHLSKTYISSFRQALNNIFSWYESQSGSSSSDSFTGGLGSTNLEKNKVTSETDLEFDEFVMRERNDAIQKTELEKYLEEPLFPKGADESKFDVLIWWKSCAPKYPTLAKMARDILAVPVSTVPSQYVFTGVDTRELNGHRAYNVPEFVQALTCIKSWLP